MDEDEDLDEEQNDLYALDPEQQRRALFLQEQLAQLGPREKIYHAHHHGGRTPDWSWVGPSIGNIFRVQHNRQVDAITGALKEIRLENQFRRQELADARRQQADLRRQRAEEIKHIEFGKKYEDAEAELAKHERKLREFEESSKTGGYAKTPQQVEAIEKAKIGYNKAHRKLEALQKKLDAIETKRQEDLNPEDKTNWFGLNHYQEPHNQAEADALAIQAERLKHGYANAKPPEPGMQDFQPDSTHSLEALQEGEQTAKEDYEAAQHAGQAENKAAQQAERDEIEKQRRILSALQQLAPFYGGANMGSPVSSMRMPTPSSMPQPRMSPPGGGGAGMGPRGGGRGAGAGNPSLNITPQGTSINMPTHGFLGMMSRMMGGPGMGPGGMMGGVGKGGGPPQVQAQHPSLGQQAMAGNLARGAGPGSAMGGMGRGLPPGGPGTPMLPSRPQIGLQNAPQPQGQGMDPRMLSPQMMGPAQGLQRPGQGMGGQTMILGAAPINAPMQEGRSAAMTPIAYRPGGGGQAPVSGGGQGGVKSVIDAAAARHGIDPRRMYGIVAGESAHGNRYDKNFGTPGHPEASYGLFQLNMRGGMGADFLKHGIDPRDPSTIPQQADRIAQYISQGGSMSPWRGYHGDRDWNPAWGSMGYGGEGSGGGRGGGRGGIMTAAYREPSGGGGAPMPPRRPQQFMGPQLGGRQAPMPPRRPMGADNPMVQRAIKSGLDMPESAFGGHSASGKTAEKWPLDRQPSQSDQVGDWNMLRRGAGRDQGLEMDKTMPPRGGGHADIGLPAQPKIGQVIGGHRYKGGDPSKRTSWVPVMQI